MDPLQQLENENFRLRMKLMELKQSSPTDESKLSPVPSDEKDTLLLRSRNVILQLEQDLSDLNEKLRISNAKVVHLEKELENSASYTSSLKDQLERSTQNYSLLESKLEGVIIESKDNSSKHDREVAKIQEKFRAEMATIKETYAAEILKLQDLLESANREAALVSDSTRNELEAEVEAMKTLYEASNQDAEKQLALMRELVSGLQDELAVMQNTTIPELQSELEKSNQEKGDLKEEVRRLEASIMSLEELFENQRQATEFAQNRVKMLHEQISQAETTEQSLRQVISDLRDDISSLKDSIVNEEQEKLRLQRALTDVHVLLQEERDKVHKLETAMANADMEHGTSLSNVEQIFSHEKQELLEELEATKQALHEARETLSASVSAAEGMNLARISLQERLNLAIAESNDWKEKYSAKMSEIGSIQALMHTMQTEYETNFEKLKVDHKAEISRIQTHAESRISSLEAMYENEKEHFMDTRHQETNHFEEKYLNLQKNMRQMKQDALLTIQGLEDELKESKIQIDMLASEKSHLEQQLRSVSKSVEEWKAKSKDREVAVKQAMATWLSLIGEKFADLLPRSRQDSSKPSESVQVFLDPMSNIVQDDLSSLALHSSNKSGRVFNERVMDALELLPQVSKWFSNAAETLSNQMKARVALVNQDSTALETRIKSLEQTVETILAKHQQRAHSHAAEMDELMNSLTSIRKQLVSVISERDELEHMSNTLREKNKGLEHNIEVLQSQHGELKKMHSSASASLLQAEETIRALRAELEQLVSTNERRERYLQNHLEVTELQLRSRATVSEDEMKQLQAALEKADRELRHVTSYALPRSVQSAFASEIERVEVIVQETQMLLDTINAHVDTVANWEISLPEYVDETGPKVLPEPAWLIPLKSAMAEEASAARSLAQSAQSLAIQLRKHTEGLLQCVQSDALQAGFGMRPEQAVPLLTFLSKQEVADQDIDKVKDIMKPVSTPALLPYPGLLQRERSGSANTVNRSTLLQSQAPRAIYQQHSQRTEEREVLSKDQSTFESPPPRSASRLSGSVFHPSTQTLSRSQTARKKSSGMLSYAQEILAGPQEVAEESKHVNRNTIQSSSLSARSRTPAQTSDNLRYDNRSKSKAQWRSDRVEARAKLQELEKVLGTEVL